MGGSKGQAPGKLRLRPVMEEIHSALVCVVHAGVQGSV